MSRIFNHYWPTVVVSACCAWGTSYLWALLMLPENLFVLGFMGVAISYFFPWQVMFMNDVLGPWPTFLLAFCLASFLAVCMYEVNRRSLRLAVLGLALYASVSAWMYFHLFDIMLVGTTLRRICGACTAIHQF